MNKFYSFIVINQARSDGLYTLHSSFVLFTSSAIQIISNSVKVIIRLVHVEFNQLW